MAIIREATAKDAGAVCDLLRQSITILCVDDHKNDPAVLARWRDSKKPETITAWILETGGIFLVANEGEQILSVGAASDRGEITLNYVHPSFRFQGLSHTMVRALELYIKKNGNAQSSLLSTITARRFYLACGYSETKAVTGPFGVMAYPMSKIL